MVRTWSLRSHVALLVAVMVVAVATIMGGMASETSVASMVSDVGRGLAQTAAGLGGRLDADMHARASEVAGLSELPALMDPATGHRVAAALLQEEPALAWFGVLDAHGLVLASSHGVLEGTNIAVRPVFAQGIKGPYLGDVHQAVLLGGLLKDYGFGHSDDGSEIRFVDVSRPIMEDGRAVGVVAAHFSWDWASRLARAASQDAGYAGLDMFVLGADGSVLAGPPGSAGKKLDTPASRASRSSTASGYSVERWDDGELYLVGYSQRGPLGWTVLSRERLSDAMLPSALVRRQILLLGIALAAVFSILGWYGAGFVSRPLQAIAAAAERMAHDRSEGSIPKVGGSTEVEMLSCNLRTLVRALTRRDEAIADLSRIAERDNLTGLANRLAFDRRLEALGSVSGEPSTTVMLVDLDDFKPVNDTYGHAAGDVVLRAVGARLRRCLRPEDFAGRIGGDEFAILFDRVVSERDAEAVAARIVEAISAPVQLEDVRVSVGCCVGIAAYPEDGSSLAQTLEAADRALYRAKRSGKRLVRAASSERRQLQAAGAE